MLLEGWQVGLVHEYPSHNFLLAIVEIDMCHGRMVTRCPRQQAPARGLRCRGSEPPLLSQLTPGGQCHVPGGYVGGEPTGSAWAMLVRHSWSDVSLPPQSS